MELEPKHIASYLPYGLKGEVNGSIVELIGYYEDLVVCKSEKYSKVTFHMDCFKPLLKTLSELDKAIFSYGIYPSYFEDIIDGKKQFDLQDCPYWLYETLVKNHYDVFGLKEARLAIDKTLNKIYFK